MCRASVTDKFEPRRFFAQLQRRESAAAGARVRRRHRSGRSPAKKASAETKIAFKAQPPAGNGEIYVSDFDGHDAQAVTHDNAIVAAPAWVPGRLALYYTSYKPGNPDIFYHNLSTGQRRSSPHYPGLNTSAAVSPDGSKVAMILSKSGSPNVWVCNADGTNLKQLTLTREDDSSPCWSPDGQWICFATKIRRAPRAGKVPAGGGAVQRIPTSGVPIRPSRTGRRTANGSRSRRRWASLTSASCRRTAGRRRCWCRARIPSWSPNSRTLIFVRRNRWKSAICLCLTCSRNKSRICPDFGKQLRTHNPVGRDKPF